MIILSTFWHRFARKIPFGWCFWQNNDTIICSKQHPREEGKMPVKPVTRLSKNMGVPYNQTPKCCCVASEEIREHSIAKDFYVGKQLLNAYSTGINKTQNGLGLYPYSFVLTVHSLRQTKESSGLEKWAHLNLNANEFIHCSTFSQFKMKFLFMLWLWVFSA